MGTSTVTIEGGAFVIRTGNLLTKFSSLESAAEQIALLHDAIGMRKLFERDWKAEIERLKNENRRMRAEKYAESMNKQTDREKAQTAQFRRLAAENADLRAEVDRLRDWMQRVTDAVVDWRTKVTGTAGSGCPIDAVVMLAKQWLRDKANTEEENQ